MDKLIKAIPDDHMGIIETKADAREISSSAYIRDLIRKDVGVMDIIIKDIAPDKAHKLKMGAAAKGLTIEQYIFLNL